METPDKQKIYNDLCLEIAEYHKDKQKLRLGQAASNYVYYNYQEIYEDVKLTSPDLEPYCNDRKIEPFLREIANKIFEFKEERINKIKEEERVKEEQIKKESEYTLADIVDISYDIDDPYYKELVTIYNNCENDYFKLLAKLNIIAFVMNGDWFPGLDENYGYTITCRNDKLVVAVCGEDLNRVAGAVYFEKFSNAKNAINLLNKKEVELLKKYI